MRTLLDRKRPDVVPEGQRVVAPPLLDETADEGHRVDRQRQHDPGHDDGIADPSHPVGQRRRQAGITFAGERRVHLAVWSLDEPVGIGAGIRRQRADETDVRTLRGLDGTDAPVVRVVNVTHIKACAFTRETARAKSRETSLMPDLSQCICLIHEL